MKKIFSIILLLFFLIANSNLVMSMHKCGGKVTHLGINSLAKSKCGCGKQMDADCCKDVQVKIKINNNDYQSSINKVIFSNFWKVIETSIFSELRGEFSNYFLISNGYSLNHSPPINNKAPAYLVNCVFIV